MAEWLTTSSESLLLTSNVEIHVGEEKTKLFVHPSFVRPRSHFFKAALENLSAAGAGIVLPNDEASIFDLWLQDV